MKLSDQQVRGLLILTGTALMSLTAGFVVGRIVGISEMSKLVGEGVSAETIFYLAQRDHMKWDEQ